MAFKSCPRLLWQGSGLRRRLGAALLAAILGLQPVAATAEVVGRHAVLVIDANTGRTLYERSAGDLRHPASLTKLMTLYLLFEMIEQGRLSLTSTIRFSANAAAAQPSRLEVEEGTEITVADAIKALIVKSANDVAIAVGELIAGDEDSFAELMTRKARELGMKSTEFHNASGLPHPEQVTTARDMTVLALRLYDQFPRYYHLFSSPTFTWGGDTFRNHNTLLFSYRGLEGMKTGYIRASGFNLVASARRGKKHVLVAYFGGKTAAQRNVAVRSHLDAAFTKASDQRTRRPSTTLAAVAKASPAPKSAPPARATLAKATPPPIGGEGKAAAVAVAAVPAPQPARRVAAVAEFEVARVRPVRVPASADAAARTEAAPAETEVAAAPAAAVPLAVAHAAPLAARVDAAEASRDADPAPEAAKASPAAAAADGDDDAAAPTGSFHIQIGAYQTKGEAERQLTAVRERAGTLLGTHAAYMSQVKRGDKVLFRARYVGFDAQPAAAGICGQLKRMEIDCLVMKAE